MNAGLKAGSGFKVHIILSLALLVAAIVLGGTYPGSGAPTAAAATARSGMTVCGEEALHSRDASGSGGIAEQKSEKQKTTGRKPDSRAVRDENKSTLETCSGN
jgi:hypothetical protein